MKHLPHKILFALVLSLAFGSNVFAATFTNSVGSITRTSAVISLAITPANGETVTAAGVQYGTTTAYGTTLTGLPVTGNSSSAITITGLTCNTKYYYQAFITTNIGMVVNTGSNFTTSNCITTSIPVATNLNSTPITNTLTGITATKTLPGALPVAGSSLVNLVTTPVQVAPSTITTPITTVPSSTVINTVPTQLSPTSPVVPSLSLLNGLPSTNTNVNAFNPINTQITGPITLPPDPSTIVITPITPLPSSGGNGGGNGGGGYSTSVTSYNYSNNGTPATYTPTITRAPLRPKMKNPDVAVLQWVLKVKGIYTGAIDGSYGPKTKLAVKAYQTQAKTLTADGYAGKKTLAHLGILVKVK